MSDMTFESRIRISQRGDSTATFQLVGDSEAIRAAHARIMKALSELKAEFAAQEQLDRVQGCGGCGGGGGETSDAAV